MERNDVAGVGRRRPTTRGPADPGRPRRRRAGGAPRRPTTDRSCRSPRTTTSGSRGIRPSSLPRTTRSTASAPAAARRGSSSARGRCTPSSSARSPTGRGSPRAALFPTGFATNLGVLTTFGTPGVLVCSDELNHASIIDGCRLARATSRSTGTATSSSSHHCCATAGAGGRWSSPTPCSRWTVTSPTSTRSSSCARASAHCACSTRPTRCSVRPSRSTSPATSTCCGSARCRRRSGRWAVRRRARPLHRARRESGPAVHLHDRADAGRQPPPRSPRSACCARRRATRSSPGSPPRRPLRARHPSPIVPFVIGDEHATLAAAAALLERGLLVPAIRPPTVAPGHVSPARHAVGRAHRRAGRPAAAVAGRGARRASDRVTLILVTGTGTEVGKTYVTAALARARRPRPASPCSRSIPPTRPPTPTSSPPRPARPPSGSVRATGGLRSRWRRRWRPTRSASPQSTSQISCTSSAFRRRGSHSSKAGGLLSPLAHDGDTHDLIDACEPDAVVLVADAGLGTINLVRLCVEAVGNLMRRSCPQPF